MYETKISKSVYKFIKARTQKTKISIFDAFEKISKNPTDRSLDIKPLKNKENHFRLRIGKYRILYQVLEDIILVYFYKADSRGDIYKK